MEVSHTPVDKPTPRDVWTALEATVRKGHRRGAVRGPRGGGLARRGDGAAPMRGGYREASGSVQLNDIYLGGKRSGGKRGRGHRARPLSWLRSRPMRRDIRIKTALRGTYHAVRPKYAQRYLSEFEYRLNRRFDLPEIIPRLVSVALRTPPMPEQLLKLRLG